MTAPRFTTTKNSKSRDPPSPNSILDRRALEKALDAADIAVKPIHLDGMYQSLHRQHYPDLEKLVENYHRNEARIPSDDPVLPLKNAMSKWKNRNRIQLPRVLLDFLKDPENGFVTVTSMVEFARTSVDQTTTKLAVKLHDGHVVESVLMRYVTKDGSRASLCVSSQVGCAMGCTFCATGTMGIRGNLTTGEILEQVVHADRILGKEALQQNLKENGKKRNLDLVRNIVFMGMGEPLNNYVNVVEACRALIDPKRWNLAHGKVTVSTVGVIPRIRALTRDLPEISLALSLHAPNQELRTKIVPTAKAYKIEGLIEALDNHMMAYLEQDYNGAGWTKAQRIKESTRRRAMIEYVMLEGETSTFECAHQLGKLCENRHLVVNLIPYNQTDVKDNLHCPSEGHMKEFQRIVASYGSFCTIRRTMGADIASACGQLVVEKEKQTDTEAPVDIEDGPFQQGEQLNKSFGKSRGSSTRSPRDGVPTGMIRDISHKSEAKFESDDANEAQVLSKWIRPLSIATGVAATCFIASISLFLLQKRRR